MNLLVLGLTFLTSPQPSGFVGNSHALLIGCTRYPNLAESHWLRGGENDVPLLAELLSTRFEFVREDIVELVGWPENAGRRPTRANIEREFRKLADQVRPGDRVVIAMSGHGSQQPSDDDPLDLEPDGFDEIFLPADVGEWDERTGTVANAIVDDELERWLEAITARGAFVLFLMDACHSGTMTRGVERTREIPPEVLNLSRPLARGMAGGEAAPVARSRNLVSIYASQSFEPTFDLPMPGMGDPYYGLFTYTLSQVLFDASSPLSYRELAERVTNHYRGQGRLTPTPLLEGLDLDREILGTESWVDRPRILVTRAGRDGVELAGGYLHGLGEGTILAVYPTAGEGQSAQPVGHIEVVKTTATKAWGTPSAYEGSPAPELDALVEGSRCRVVSWDRGDLRLNVAVRSSLSNGVRANQVEEELARIQRERPGLLRRVEAEEADWLLRLEDESAYLVPSSGWDRSYISHPDDVAPPAFTLGRPADERFGDGLAETLERMARVHYLTELATGPLAGGRGASVRVSTELLHLEGPEDAVGRPVPYDRSGRLLEAGDRIAFKVTNQGRRAVDVTLLFIDSAYAVTPVFPRPGTGGDNRLYPGRSLVVGRSRVTAETVGIEHLLTIAVTAVSNPPMDFGELAQAGLTERAVLAFSSASSPLALLLMDGIAGQNRVRGVTAREIDEHALSLLTWRTLP